MDHAPAWATAVSLDGSVADGAALLEEVAQEAPRPPWRDRRPGWLPAAHWQWHDCLLTTRPEVEGELLLLVQGGPEVRIGQGQAIPISVYTRVSPPQSARGRRLPALPVHLDLGLIIESFKYRHSRQPRLSGALPPLPRAGGPPGRVPLCWARDTDPQPTLPPVPAADREWGGESGIFGTMSNNPANSEEAEYEQARAPSLAMGATCRVRSPSA